MDGRVSYSTVITVNFGSQNLPQVFPNPASSYFTVAAGQETMNEISIIDVSGKIIQRIVNTSGLSAITISSDNLAAGIYIIQIRTSSHVYQQKLFKQ
jgi:hypothetical protein